MTFFSEEYERTEIFSASKQSIDSICSFYFDTSDIDQIEFPSDFVIKSSSVELTLELFYSVLLHVLRNNLPLISSCISHIKNEFIDVRSSNWKRWRKRRRRHHQSISLRSDNFIYCRNFSAVELEQHRWKRCTLWDGNYYFWIHDILIFVRYWSECIRTFNFTLACHSSCLNILSFFFNKHVLMASNGKCQICTTKQSC